MSQVGITTIFRTPKADVTSFKSIVKVGYGNTSALHQLLSVHNGGDVYLTQFPFLSIGSTSGIGTFGAGYKGSNLELYFYPDSGIASQILTKSYTELIQTDFWDVSMKLELILEKIAIGSDDRIAWQGI